MKLSTSGWLVLIVLVALACWACKDNSTGSTSPTAQIVTQIFTGTIAQNGAQTFQFAIANTGAVTLTVTGLEPLAIVGLSIGTWTGEGCAVALANDTAQLGSVLSGTASVAGTYCARVYDVGGITDPVNYSVQVQHY